MLSLPEPSTLEEGEVRGIEAQGEVQVVDLVELHHVARDGVLDGPGIGLVELGVELHVLVPYPLDVRHGHGHTVRPLQAVAERDGVGGAVLAEVDGLAGQRVEVDAVGVVLHAGAVAPECLELQVPAGLAAGDDPAFAAIYADLVGRGEDVDVFRYGKPLFEGRQAALSHHLGERWALAE